MNDPLAYGEGLGSSLMIFGALLIAGLGVWVGTLIVKARRRRAEEDALDQHVLALGMSLLIAVVRDDDFTIANLTAHLDQHGYNVTIDRENQTMTLEERPVA